MPHELEADLARLAAADATQEKGLKPAKVDVAGPPEGRCGVEEGGTELLVGEGALSDDGAEQRGP